MSGFRLGWSWDFYDELVSRGLDQSDWLGRHPLGSYQFINEVKFNLPRSFENILGFGRVRSIFVVS